MTLFCTSNPNHQFVITAHNDLVRVIGFTRGDRSMASHPFVTFFTSTFLQSLEELQ